MKLGSIFAVGLIGLSFAACTPGIADAMVSDTMPPDAQISTANRPQVAFDNNAATDQQGHEQIEHRRDRNEEFSHHATDTERDDTHNLMRDHTPGVAEHQQHERHEGEAQRSNSHKPDTGY